MRDPRIDKMAAVLVHYSLQMKKGDLLWMIGESGGMPLLEALYEQSIRAGAHVFTTILPARWNEIFFQYASDEQLAKTCPFSLYASQQCTKRIRLMAPENTRALSHVDAKKQTLFSKAHQEALATVLNRAAKGELDWVTTLCPTAGLAQEAEMGSNEYAEFVFKSGYLDHADPVARWQEAEKEQARMIQFLKNKKELHFKTPQGTDLVVNVQGMTWKNSCGKRNFPDGEVFTGPNLHAADGE